LRDFTEEIPFARGPVRLSLQIQDTWSEPLIRGQATIEEGRIRSKTFNQFITINSMELSFDQKQVVLETFEGKIGGGKLLAGGRWDLEGFSSKKYSINLELESFRFNAISGLNAIVNASLLLQATPEGKSLNGEVLIQRASYDRRIDWQRFVLDVLKGDRESKTALPVGEDVRLNIQILGKDNIRINNNLAEIPLEIDLLLRGTLERPVLLGRMEARGGLIRFRQNDFKIESGAVDFIDPDRLRPILDISATTRIRTTYKVRLTLVGPIDQLELSLSSDPPLASHEILALLTFGTVPEDIDQTQMELVAGAEALDLLTGDIQIAVEEQAKKFGIDCLRVDPLFSNPKTPGTPRVTVCKRLWEDSFYVTYITTFDASGEDILQMEYLINENVSLVGGRDEIGDLGGDLKFRFEFR
jgi:autotransporter translocation and assembly factor TamB